MIRLDKISFSIVGEDPNDNTVTAALSHDGSSDSSSVYIFATTHQTLKAHDIIQQLSEVSKMIRRVKGMVANINDDAGGI